MNSDERKELAEELSREWAKSAHIIKRLAAAKELEDIKRQKEYVNHNNDIYLRNIVRKLAANNNSK